MSYVTYMFFQWSAKKIKSVSDASLLCIRKPPGLSRCKGIVLS
jgi:hypothetical protein